ncbi:MAG TPA: hypothetical protein VGE98_14210 [Thermoanaerobaculia bacterium]
MPDPTVSSAPPRKRRRALPLLILFLLAVGLLFAGYVWLALHFSYSEGERAGYVQKFSRRGWICKSWEGELLMVANPGTAPQTFQFSVRDKATAALVTKSLGQQVRLSYEQHKGVPTSCFADTEYYVIGVQPVGGR